MVAHSAFTFVVTTQENNRPAEFLSQINSHIAHHHHARRRAQVPARRLLRNLSHRGNVYIYSPSSKAWISEANKFRTPQWVGDDGSTGNSISNTDTLQNDGDADDELPGLVLDSPEHSFPPTLTQHQNSPIVSDRALLSVLDPFIKLPFNISTRDKGLMQYFLHEGRLSVSLAGISKNPKHCLALRIAHMWMEYHPIYIIGKLLCCDFMFTMAAGKELSSSYYHRKAQMLQVMRSVLSARGASFSLKLCAMMTVIWEALSTRQPDLPVHMHAMESLVASNGGVSVFLLPESDGPTMPPQFYVGMFILIEYRIATRVNLTEILDRFIQSLAWIRSWAASTQNITAVDHLPGVLSLHPDDQCSDILQPLVKFLSDAINPTAFSPNSPFFIAASPFFCTYNICMTYVTNNFTAVQAFEFLECIQRNLDIIDYECSMGGTALANLLAESRVDMSPSPWRCGQNNGVDLAEVNICQASIDAMKVFSLISPEKRLSITQTLYDIVMTAARTAPTQELFRDADLQLWREEINNAWECSQSFNFELYLEKYYALVRKPGCHNFELRNMQTQHKFETVQQLYTDTAGKA